MSKCKAVMDSQKVEKLSVKKKSDVSEPPAVKSTTVVTPPADTKK